MYHGRAGVLYEFDLVLPSAVHAHDSKGPNSISI
jgi:hypothetical protein